MRLNKGLLAAVGLLLGSWSVTGAEKFYYTGNLQPEPQQVLGDFEILKFAPGKLDIEFDSVEVMPSSKLLKKWYDEALSATKDSKAEGGRLALKVGLLTSPMLAPIADEAQYVKERKEGYVIRVVKNAETQDTTIYVGGTDNRGAFFGGLSVLSMMNVTPEECFIKMTDLNDYPIYERRFADVYYGAESTDTIDKILHFKLNGMAMQHRSNWREFGMDKDNRYYRKTPGVIELYDKEYGLVDFMLLMHVYAGERDKDLPLNIANEEEVKGVVERCVEAARNGVMHIMVCVDDMTPMRNGLYACLYPEEEAKFGSIGKAQGWLVNQVYDAVKKECPAVEISVVPAPYSQMSVPDGSPIKVYFDDMCEIMYDDIPIVWTGPVVCSRSIGKYDYDRYKKMVGNHELYVWDNSNCHEPPTPHWVTDFYEGFEKDSYKKMVYLNTNLHGRNTFWDAVFIGTAGDYLWNPSSFDVWGSYENTVKMLVGIEDFSLFKRVTNHIQQLQKVDNNQVRKQLIKSLDADIAELNKLNVNNLVWPLEAAVNRIRAVAEANLAQGDVRFVAAEPVIDGNINDEVWKNLPVYSLGTIHGDELPAGKSGTFQMAFTRDKFLFRAELNLLKPATIKKIMKHDDNVFGASDVIELFIGDGEKYAQFAVDCTGNYFDGYMELNCDYFDPEWEVASILSDDKWTVELAIPFAELEKIGLSQPGGNTIWRFNLCREYNDASEYQSWSAIGNNRFHESRLHGQIKFVE